MADKQEYSVEDVNKALMISMNLQAPDPVPDKEPEPEPIPEPVKDTEDKPAEQAAEAPAETEPAPVTKEVATEPTDDMDSLKARLAEQGKEIEEIRAKASRSVQWGRDGYLKKATELERYKGVIDRFRKGEQMTVDELDKLIGSGQAVAPSQAQQESATPNETAMADADMFAIDNGLHGERGKKFEEFMNDAAKNLTQDQLNRLAALNSVPNNTYAVLQYAYSAFQGKQAVATDAAVKATKQLQKVQKETMRAAGAAAGRARPAPPAEKPTDFSKMTPDERLKGGHVDQWLKAVVSQ